MKAEKVKKFLCNDCDFKFRTHSPYHGNKRPPFCPNCGDNAGVVSDGKKDYKLWTSEEIELIDRIIKGEIRSYQVADKLGRSRKSVMEKTARRREELNEHIQSRLSLS